MGSFDHPNVCKILGFCNDVEPHLLVMEFLAMGDLQHYLHAKHDAGFDILRVGLGTLLGYVPDRMCVCVRARARVCVRAHACVYIKKGQRDCPQITLAPSLY